MKKWVIAAAFALLVGSAVWFWASPSLAMKGLRDAALAGDKQELSDRVDFPSVRESLKSQVRVYAMAEMAKEKDNPMAGLGIMMMGPMIDNMIDGLVSPSGMKALVENGKLQKPDEAAGGNAQGEADWIVKRDGISGFRAVPKTASGDKAPTLIFKRDGLSWRLIDIEIPAGGMGSDASNGN